MTDEQFETLVKRLEAEAQQNVRAYKIRLGLLAALGYAYIFFVLGIAIAATIAIVALMISGHLNGVLIKVGIVLAVFAGTIIKSLWVTIPAPDELSLHRENFPELFAMLDDITNKLQAPRFHHVLLMSDFNASVVQIPKLGILGWQINYLMLGLPLMQALTPDQFRAVVAHEVGHLSGNHSRFSGWIYRVRQTWKQLLVNMTGGKTRERPSLAVSLNGMLPTSALTHLCWPEPTNMRRTAARRKLPDGKI